MNFRHLWKLMLVAPVAVVLAAVLGCPPASNTGSGGPGGGTEAAGTVSKPPELIATKGAKGVIKGKVTLAGTPKKDELDAKQKKRMEEGSGMDTAHCLKGDTRYQGLITKDGGVQYAVVWLRPGTTNSDHFDMDKADVEAVVKKREEEKKAVVDQPFCAFTPHAVTLFPQWYNVKAKKLEPTGEKLLVKNSAPIGHNTKAGPFGATSPEVNSTLPKETGELPISTIKPSYQKPWVLNCDVHKYMEGFVWAFEHPFAAVTDETGNFTIEGVPTGKDLYIVVWHESADGDGKPGFLNQGKAAGEKIKVEEGKPLEKNYELKVK